MKGAKGADQHRNGFQTGVECLVSRKLVSVRPPPQKRLRLRRTYQFDRFSPTNSWMGRAAGRRIVVFERAVTFRTSVLSREMIQRSISGRFAHRNLGFLYRNRPRWRRGRRTSRCCRACRRTCGALPPHLRRRTSGCPTAKSWRSCTSARGRNRISRGREGIDGIAQSLGHLVAVLVEHQTVGDDSCRKRCRTPSWRWHGA